MENFENIFLGRGWAFPPSFSKSQREVKILTNEELIHNSLMVLISTIPTERIMQPDYGCDLRDFFFEPLEVSLIKRMTDRIEQNIIKFEPRVRVIKIDTEDLNATDGRIDIHVHYEIKATNSRYNLVFPFYLEEGKVKP